MLNRPPQGAQCDINYAVMWLELHIHELYLRFSHMTCGTLIHFMRHRSWFYLMVTRYLFDGTHFNSISSLYDGCGNQEIYFKSIKTL